MLRVPPSLGESQERLVTQVIDCGFHVHSVLGPGFKERIYVQAFRLELHSRGLSFESEKSIDVRYKEWTIPGQRVDLVIGGLVIVEIKAVPKLTALHRKQVLSYLKTMNRRIGLLMDFNSAYYKHGIKRVAL